MKSSAQLRKEAEERLTRKAVDINEISENTRELVYELYVHQVELEMQNEELNKAHQELISARDRYIDLYDFAPMGYVTLNTKAVILEINLTLANWLGQDRTQLLGRLFTSYIYPSDKDAFYIHYRHVCKTGSTPPCEIRLEGKQQGYYVQLLFSIEGFEHEQDGKIRVAVSDISKLKKIEQELRTYQNDLNQLVRERTQKLTETNFQLKEEIAERIAIQKQLVTSETRQKAILEAIPDTIIRLNQNGIILDAYASSQTNFGNPVESIGQPLEHSLSSEFAKALKQTANIVMSIKKPVTKTYEYRLKNHNYSMECRFSICGPDELIIIIRDVTEAKNMEANLRQSQKMQALGQMAGGVAHHYNNILTSVLGYLELALLTLPDDHEIKADLEQVQRSSQKAANLTEQLLTFTSQTVVPSKIMTLKDLVKRSIPLINAILPESIELATDLETDAGQIKVNRNQFEQLLVSLVFNAKEAMNNGGLLRLVTQPVEIPMTSNPSANFPKPGDYALLQIIDTGTGIPEALQPHLFEPFFTTKEVGGGAGLGLSTVFGIIRQHQGYVTIDSELGQGTTVNLYWPRLMPQKATTESTGSRPLLTENQTVLLVEDEETVLFLGERALHQMGITPYTAVDGLDALQLLEANQALHLDLLITDVMMPRMDGRELALYLLERNPELKVLFLTGYAPEKIMTLMPEPLKRFPLLRKPFSLADMSQKISETMQLTK